MWWDLASLTQLNIIFFSTTFKSSVNWKYDSQKTPAAVYVFIHIECFLLPNVLVINFDELINEWLWGSFFFKMLTHYTKEWITLAARPDNLQQNLNCALLKWLEGVFQGQYLPSLPMSPLTKIWKNYRHSCIRYRWKFVMIRVAILSSCHSNEIPPLLTALEAVFLGTGNFFFPKSFTRSFFLQ